MKRIACGMFTILTLASIPGQAAEGMTAFKSPYSAKETLDRLTNLAEQKGMKIFARIDHAEGAKKVGKTLRPTELLIFGNPQGGTPFMECAQTVAIDLPMKALAWKDDSNQVWLGYNDPGYIARRHDAARCGVVDKLDKTLRSLAEEAVSR